MKLQPKPIKPSGTNVSLIKVNVLTEFHFFRFHVIFLLNLNLVQKKPRTASESSDQGDSNNKPIERKALISFVYNEGFSDAVRCKIKIQDLL